MTTHHQNRETRPTKRSVRLASVSKPSVTCMTSVMILLMLMLMLMLCRMDNGVHSMVVTTPRRSRVATTKTINNKNQAAATSTPDVGIAANNSRSKIETDRNSEEVIRMLLEGQGGTDRRARNPSQQQQLPVAPSSSSTRTSHLLDQWRDYEPLRETNMEDDVLRPFFFESGWKRKQLIAQRFGTVIRTLYTAQADWKAFRERKKQLLELGDKDESAKAIIAEEETAASAKLCAAVASLGPLAVKLGQTLSQRPDMVGKDACLALKRLQTQTAPFDNELAMEIVRESLEYWDGPLAANLDGGDVNDNDNDNDNDNGEVDDDHRIRRQASGTETSPCCHSERLRHWKGRYLAPASPERAPGTWMLINIFMLVWSLSLGSYLTLLYWWYRNNNNGNNNNNNNNTNGNDFSPTSRESTTDYMLWSLLTTLVWVAEISLRAAFPKIDTVLVVFNHDEEHLPDDDEAPLQSCSADGTRNEDSHEDGMPGARPLFLHSATAETRSVVTIERVVQKRSLKQRVVIVTELLLAVFFGIETVGDCWNFWHSRRSSSRIGDTDDYVYREDDQYYDHDYYDYDYDDNDDDEGGKFYQQQADVWVSVLAYAYMTYETYHAYRRSTTTQREIERSLSTVSQSQQRPSQRQQRGRDATVTAATTVATTATATTPPLEVMVHGIRPQDPASASASTSTSSALSLDPKHKAGKDIEPMVTACLAESCSDVTPDENDGNSSNNSSNNNNNNNDNNNDNGKA